MTGSPMRVGLVGPVPPPNGGMAMQMRQLAQLLSKEGIDIELLPTNPPYRPAWVEQLRGIRAVFRLLPYLGRAWRLAGRVDVIHMMANSGWSWQLFSAPVVWAAWLRGTPVIINYRGGEALAYFQQSFSRVKPTLGRACNIVVPSGFLQKVFADFGVSAIIIPNIINLELFRPNRCATESDEFTLVVTRNLEPIYGIATAIEAVGLVRDKIPEVRLKVAGSGPQLQELQELVKHLALEPNVSFVGRLEPDDIAALYQGAHGMLNPTTVDNMPNSILEALACGLPIISTDVGGIPYIVEHEITALLMPPGDERQMAAAIIRLHDDTALRDSLSAAGVSKVRQYAWPEVKGDWLDLYQRSAAGGVA